MFNFTTTLAKFELIIQSKADMKNTTLTEGKKLFTLFEELLHHQDVEGWYEIVDNSIRAINVSTETLKKDEINALYELRNFFKKLK